MKRKPPVRTERPVAPEIPAEVTPVLAEAALAKRGLRCVVCNGEATGAGEEQLCWVCRRLKISAWRDSEQPTAVQE